MGSRGDNGGERPPEGGGLPDLPPEWGTVIIPPDASALEAEAEAIRRQFRREARRRTWRRRFHLTPESRGAETAGLAVPLLIMSIAVLATLTSLFVIAWPGQQGMSERTPDIVVTTVAAVAIGDLTFVEPSGARVRLADLSPAVLLLVDGCACAELITATVRAVEQPARATQPETPGPPGTSTTGPSGAPVSVLVVGLTAPSLPSAVAGNVRVRALADPVRALRAAVPGLSSVAGPSAVLVGRTGAVARTLPRVGSVEEFRADLARLTA